MLCRTVGAASPNELFERISWEEFLLWEAEYNREPWGEFRADARQAVGIRYTLAPWLEDKGGVDQWPAVFWPYFDEQLKHADDLVAYAAEHDRKWAQWEQERINGLA